MSRLKSILAVSIMATFLAACNSDEQATHTQSAKTTQPVVQSVALTHTYSGEITGYEMKKITFMAEKGQVLTVNSLLKESNAQVVLYGYDDFLEEEAYTLPATGEYEIRILQPRNFARKGSTAKYKVEITLK
ncbi:hypothetical protein CEP45_04170 [Mergibacter septicus]|uniref:hypothetical protein n=1 Tax=Mergibacter septicus TaxID=221402 RepID=UPI001C77853F|nr:hypothetical protein [Mergibacter septicus]QDJ13095.1 hypothetical protein CEP45_04170 [Mergibacter septicus]